MSACVLDCAIAVAWCFEDEATPEDDALLEHVRRDGARATGWTIVNGKLSDVMDSPRNREPTMRLAASEKELADRTARYLKAELKRAGVTYAELAKRLEVHGLKETEGSIANKLIRGSIAATFLLATLAALELEGVRLEEL